MGAFIGLIKAGVSPSGAYAICVHSLDNQLMPNTILINNNPNKWVMYWSLEEATTLSLWKMKGNGSAITQIKLA